MPECQHSLHFFLLRWLLALSMRPVCEVEMNKEFEIWMRQRYGNRYDLTRDMEDIYCREIVRRMFDVWRYCRGLSVV
ncbi:TPA: hypothetical protein G9F11_002118 [Salmonella enterica]|uniref:Uncharacterized protein n=1 Tax=Salmonella enterica TaxID=28901 RepID=A0A750HMJ8_SALER|nr:hypothetical protein [Salmonella enterica]EJK8887021.1 hypothetical protein [Salmonella enterica]HAF6259528.1 hypothetical protein [Salmonella enterica]